MPTYLLRAIDPDLWDKVKQRAASEGLPLRALILALLRGYAAGDIQVRGSREPASIVYRLLAGWVARMRRSMTRSVSS